jgi:hypothetical protein
MTRRRVERQQEAKARAEKWSALSPAEQLQALIERDIPGKAAKQRARLYAEVTRLHEAKLEAEIKSREDKSKGKKK